ALATPPPRTPRAALAAPPPRGGAPARDREIRIVPDRARSLPRVSARHLRHARARRSPSRDPEPAGARRSDRHARALAVRGGAHVQLRRKLHLRRRRAARRAPRASALRRSRAAPRAARRGGAA